MAEKSVWEKAGDQEEAPWTYLYTESTQPWTTKTSCTHTFTYFQLVYSGLQRIGRAETSRVDFFIFMSEEKNPTSSSLGNTEKEPFQQVNSGETSSETASLSTCREYSDDKTSKSFDSDTSASTAPRSDPGDDFSSTQSEVLETITTSHPEKGTISATHSPSLPTELDFPRAEDRKASVRSSSVEFGPCSQKSFHSASILLAAQQQLDISRKTREEAIHRELLSEEQMKKEQRLQLEQNLRAEAEEQNKSLELQRRQELEHHEQQRINEERQRQLEEERRQQQLLDQEKEKRLEEERQRREYLKRQEIEQKRKQQEEAEIRKQKAIEDQIRRRKEEKARLERQCEFPASANIKPTNIPSTNSTQHHHSDLRSSTNGQQFYLYKDPKRQQQHQRSGTESSNGETPMKFRSTRNHPHDEHPHKHLNNTPDTPTLFFERIVNEEVAEIKSYTEIIQNQNREIIELKNNNNEMELRLEHQTKDRIELESTIEDQEIHWNKKCEQLEHTVDSYMKSLETEKTTNKKLWDLVYAKEKEIQRAYQRRVSQRND